MLRFLVRRLTIIPPGLVLVHFFGFAYGLAGRWFQLTQDPMHVVTQPPPAIGREYAAYLQQALGGEWGKLPGGSIETVLEAVVRTGRASLGLLAIAFTLSLLLGLLLGLASIRTNPPRVAGWLVPVAAVSLSMPSFYIGALLVTASIFYLFNVPGGKLPFPLRGYGWDIHLVLPTLVLMVRPTMQLAQVTAAVLADELTKQYVVAGRSLGHSWRRVRWKTALRNVTTPIILGTGSAFRLVIVELILVEWLFGWPGLGSLLAATLFRPQLAATSRLLAPPASYLDPPLLAAVLATFALLFLLGDTVTAVLVRVFDPRLRAPEGEA